MSLTNIEMGFDRYIIESLAREYIHLYKIVNKLGVISAHVISHLKHIYINPHPMHIADVKEAKLYIRHGWNNMDQGMVIAAYSGNLQLLKYFQTRGANINKYSDALEGAALGGNLHIVKYLVHRGVSADIEHLIESTIQCDCFNVASWLIAYWSQILSTTDLTLSDTAISRCMKYEKWDIIENLIRKHVCKNLIIIMAVHSGANALRKIFDIHEKGCELSNAQSIITINYSWGLNHEVTDLLQMYSKKYPWLIVQAYV